MLTIGPLAFVVPAALFGLLLLPVLYWLMRVTPPAPARISFPAVRLLALIAPSEQTAQRTPPWLLLLRLLLALMVILGAAHPLLNAAPGLKGTGPLVLIVDDGWAAARDWPDRLSTMTSLIDVAEREKRDVILVTTAQTAEQDGRPRAPVLSAGEARRLAQKLQPRPWPSDRAGAIAALGQVDQFAGSPPGEVFWLSDGLDQPNGGVSMTELVGMLKPFGHLTLFSPTAAELALMVQSPESVGGKSEFRILRPAGSGIRTGALRLLTEDGEPLAREEFRFDEKDTKAEISVSLPSELARRFGRVEIEDETTAGSVVLIDEQWRPKPVGLALTARTADDQPLLSSLYYLERALTPFAEVRKNDVETLLKRELAVLVLDDQVNLEQATRDRIRRWVEAGGVLLRFAGPNMARSTDADSALLPVRVRAGDRTIGGALSWRRPAKLAPFAADTPFSGLEVPADVEIRRQVLAEPSLTLSEQSWARLEDGTPLVTAARAGKGWLVLFHTTANPAWSDLPLSGLFVDMLKRIVALSQGTVSRTDGPPLHPVNTLDGYGRLGLPPAEARAIAPESLSETEIGPSHPPGIYASPTLRRALNLSQRLAQPSAIAALPPGVDRATYGGTREIDFRPWLIALALLLVVVDLAVSLRLRGLLAGARSTPFLRRIAVILVFAATFPGHAVHAEEIFADGSAIPYSLTTRLAYVLTGNSEDDAISHAGLTGLSAVVNRRTAAELGAPVGVDPEVDELAFYPLLYWFLKAGNPLPSATASRKLKEFMRGGGTILFDTRGRGGGRSGEFRQLVQALEIPPLIAAPENHLIGRSYYLLSEFPGRRSGGTVWVVPSGEHINDGVTSVIAGTHDWAGAWAVDELQKPMFAVVPGGERQREMAYRFGINVVMHVLTGSYKADQVHLPAILERLDR